MRWQARVARGEQGTSLVLALAFMSLFGVSAGLLAQFGAVSFKTVASVREQRATVYAAEGAVDTAIDNVRSTATQGTNGGPCTQVTLPSVGTHAIDATCVGQVPDVGGSVAASLPSQALLTTATGSEDGITTIGGTVKTSGGVFSNSDVSGFFGAVDAGSSPLTARGSCSQGTGGTPVTCNVGSGGHTEGNDPNYPSPLTSVPAHMSVPSCPSAANKVVWFSPGFYDDDAGLNALTNGGCPNAVLWFQPGAYYFDFDWKSGDTSHTWTVSDSSVNVVGGTATWNTSQTAPTRPVINSPGACKTESSAAPNDGVQFVFGGDSNVVSVTGDFELCATPDANGRELAIYGQKTGAVSATPGVTPLLEPTAGGSGATSISGFASPLSPTNAVNAIDGVLTTATVTGNSKVVAMTTRGYDVSSIRSDSHFGSIAVHIAHREATTTAMGTPTLTLNSSNGTTCSTTLTKRSVLTPDTWAPPCVNSIDDLQGLTFKYSVQMNSTGNPSSLFSMDGIDAQVTYTPPVLRTESGCITIPSGQSGACDLVFLSTNFTGTFNINGTVYAPLARFTLELGGIFGGSVTRVQFTRGIVLRAVVFWDAPFDSSAPPTISIPPSGRTVVFTGNVDHVRRVRAVVNFVDNPTVGAEVDVTSWSVTR